MANDQVTEPTAGRAVSRRGFLGAAGAAGVAGGVLGLVGPAAMGDVLSSATGVAGAATKPKTGGTLTWSVSSDTTTLDPAFATLGSGGPTTGLESMCIYDSLALLNAKTLTVAPKVLQSLTVDSTGSTWTLTLRSGVLFSDGTTLDASAIKAHWDRIQLPATASTLRSVLAGWNYVVTSPTVLTVTLPQPQGNFPENMTLQYGAIPSPAAVTKYGKLYGTGAGYVVGAGAFTVQAWVTGNSYALSKNPNYYISGQPYVDQIDIQVITNEAVNLEAMLSNTVDIGYFSSPDVNTNTLIHEGYQNVSASFPSAYGVQYNFSKAPFNDLRVRQALLLATNPAVANAKATDSAAVTAGGTWYPQGSPFYDPSVKQKSNNLAAAQKLLNAYIAEKGAIPAQQLTVYNTSFGVALATALIQQWSQLKGLSITANVVSTTQAILLYATGNYSIAASLIPGYLWPADAYVQLYTGGTANIFHYSNPKMDALLTSTRGASTLAARKTGVNQIAQILVDDAAFIRIYYANYHQFAQKNVGGLSTFIFGTGGAWPVPSTVYLTS
jgi:peptide/nickel transport system substrate-binding protein